MHAKLLTVMVLLSSVAGASAEGMEPIRLRVDLSDAPRRLVHATEQIPVHPGTNDFWYPQWIPGQELPGGPIDSLTGIFFRAGGEDGAIVPWRRDLTNPYEFHVQVPGGVSLLNVRFDVLEVPSRFNKTSPDTIGSHVALLETSDVVLYPSRTPVNAIPVTVTVHLPDAWKAATALRVDEAAVPTLNGPETTFHTVSVEQFVDSPILAGQHCRQYPLAPEVHPVHTLDLCADNDGGLEIKPEFLAHMSELVRQTTKLFQGHHYDHFDFLVALSPHLTGGGLEHTQSTHYVVKASSLGDPAIEDFAAYLMAHEYTHAWCGKYRRPAGDATPDYNTPMQNDLLWVYEGLTEYYGGVLAARSGFRTADQAVNAFGYSLFRGDQPGRAWRSVQDTADASAMFRDVDSSWANWRLSQDYYWDGALLWLEADVKIRQLSHSTKSLDDFAALFLGSPRLGTPPGDTGPGVVPYTFADVVKALNATQPFEWENFWNTHLNELTPKLPTDGLKKAGYDYAYSEKMSEAEASFIEPAHMAEMYHSLGFQVMSDGMLSDVWFGSPSFFAGLGPGDKLTQVDGKPYTPEAITEAVRAAKKNALPITLTAIRDDETKTFLIQYHEGLKFSVLRRNANPDLLTMGILRPR